jgi:hypothetical protein
VTNGNSAMRRKTPRSFCPRKSLAASISSRARVSRSVSKRGSSRRAAHNDGRGCALRAADLRVEPADAMDRPVARDTCVSAPCRRPMEMRSPPRTNGAVAPLAHHGQCLGRRDHERQRAGEPGRRRRCRSASAREGQRPCERSRDCRRRLTDMVRDDEGRRLRGSGCVPRSGTATRAWAVDSRARRHG